MSNYVIIPMDSSSLPLATGALTGTATGGGTVGPASGTATASDEQDVSGGSGSGAKATILQGSSNNATIAAATITITVAGDGYKEGDIVTIPIIAASGQKTSTTAVVSYTILAADLVTADSQAEELLPVEDVACVDVVDTGATIDILLKQATALKKYTLSLDGGTADNYEEIAIHVNGAIQKAMQAENRQPIMTFPLGISCYDVVLS
jgi:hypothetical protein